MIINKKWCANKGQYFIWMSPTSVGADYAGAYFVGTNPSFADLSGDHLIVGRVDVAGEFVSDEIPPSSLWDFFATEVFPSTVIDGHTGLWAIDAETDEISPTRYTPKFKDIFWEYLDGEISLGGTQDSIGGG